MPRILGVGIATLDIVHGHRRYPAEDTESRADEQHIWRGGNVTNSLCVLAQLGHRCDWAGTLGDDVPARLIEADLRGYGVGLDTVKRIPGGASPVSMIWLGQAAGTRTISHYRDLPELDAEHFLALSLASYDWLHFEGRAVDQTQRMLRDAARRSPHLPRSLEIEKARDGIEQLLPLADVLLFSRQYALASGFDDAASLLAEVRRMNPRALLVCAWGERGAWYSDPAGDSGHVPAFAPPRIVDTRAAGDVFNAGFIHASLKGETPGEAVATACRLAGKKCAEWGLSVKGLA